MAPPRSSAEIREAFLSFFEARDHRRMPSASLIPASYDPSVLLTTAGMQPFKPYFLGQEQPPHSAPHLLPEVLPHDRHRPGRHRPPATSRSSRCWATSRSATTSSRRRSSSPGSCPSRSSGSTREQIWITVFEGDPELGLGPDEEAIDCWRSVGVPDERIVRLPRSENFWQAGPVGPCGPCSELYIDRGPDFGADEDRPGDDTERFLEYWNLVFMQYSLHEDGTARAAPAARTSTPAWASTGWPRSSRTCRPCSRTISSVRWSSSGRSFPGAGTARTSRPPRRCGCWPTTAAR